MMEAAIGGGLALAFLATLMLIKTQSRGLQIEIRDQRPVASYQPPNNLKIGYFGEMLTSILLAQKCWKQIPSHYGSMWGLDGIFLRELSDGGTEVLLVETKTTQSQSTIYDPAQMSDDKVTEELDKWSPLDPYNMQIASAVIDAIRNGSRHVRKELWCHDIVVGTTAVYRLTKGGEKTLPGKLITGLSHRRLIEALHISSDNFGKLYKVVPPADGDDV